MDDEKVVDLTMEISTEGLIDNRSIEQKAKEAAKDFSEEFF